MQHLPHLEKRRGLSRLLVCIAQSHLNNFDIIHVTNRWSIFLIQGILFKVLCRFLHHHLHNPAHFVAEFIAAAEVWCRLFW